MTIERGIAGEHATHWRKVLNKPERPAADGKLTQTERFAAWSARRRDEAMVSQTRSDFRPASSAYEIGEYHYAPDNSVWRRIA